MPYRPNPTDENFADARKVTKEYLKKTAAFREVNRLEGVVAQNLSMMDTIDEMLGLLRDFPGFTDDASVGDIWLERMRFTVAKAEGRS